MAQAKASFSVICCTYNGYKKLSGLLHALENLTMISDLDVEFLFVVDGSTDSSLELLEGFRVAHPNLEVLIIKNANNFGLSESRNIGIVNAGGEYVAFLDDDCRPPSSWLQNLDKTWARTSTNVVGVGGYVFAATSQTLNQKFCQDVQPVRPVLLSTSKKGIASRLKIYYGRLNYEYGYAEYLVGANMSFRRNALIAVDYFLPSMRFGGDDTYICNRLREQFGDSSLIISSSLPMNHEYAQSFIDSLKRSFSYGQGTFKNYWVGTGNLSLNPGPIFVPLAAFELALNFTGIHKNSQWINHIVIASALVTICYSLFIGSWKFNKWRNPLKAITLGVAYFLCEIANVSGFVSYLPGKAFSKIGFFR